MSNWVRGYFQEYKLDAPVSHHSLQLADRHLLEKGERLFVVGGSDFGRFLRLVSQNGNHALFVVAGHKAWYGRGEQKYYPKTYILARFKKPNQLGLWGVYLTFDTEQQKEKGRGPAV